SASRHQRDRSKRRLNRSKKEAKTTPGPTTQCRSKKSPLKVSQKRGYSADGLETFGGFPPRLPIFGGRRPIRNMQKIAEKCRVFASKLTTIIGGWRRSGDRTCLHPNSLQTGNLSEFVPKRRRQRAKNACRSDFF